mgnify:CR=1 FL=1
MAVFLFSLFINVGEVEAEGFDCKGSKQAVRQCLKNVIKWLEQEKAGREPVKQTYILRFQELLDANGDASISNEESNNNGQSCEVCDETSKFF